MFDRRHARYEYPCPLIFVSTLLHQCSLVFQKISVHYHQLFAFIFLQNTSFMYSEIFLWYNTIALISRCWGHVIMTQQCCHFFKIFQMLSTLTWFSHAQTVTTVTIMYVSIWLIVVILSKQPNIIIHSLNTPLFDREYNYDNHSIMALI